MSWKTPIKLTIQYVTLFRNAMRDYSKEFGYFARAKASYTRNSLAELDNNSILVRKRTHHLERYLWHRQAYLPAVGQQAAADVEALLGKKNKDLSLRQEGWARRIHREYQKEGNAETLCPVLIHGVKREPAAVDPAALMQLLRQRRSRRVFKNVPLTDDEKSKITEAAQHAPSSCNRQTIDLIFVEDEALKQFVSSTIPGGYQFFHNAPAIVIFVSDARDYKYPEDRTAPFIDAAAAVENVYLLCETMGLGCCWGSYTSFGNIFNEQGVRERLGIPPTHLIVASLAVGQSDQFVCEIPREPAQKRYGNNYFRRHEARDSK